MSEARWSPSRINDEARRLMVAIPKRMSQDELSALLKLLFNSGSLFVGDCKTGDPIELSDEAKREVVSALIASLARRVSHEREIEF